MATRPDEQDQARRSSSTGRVPPHDLQAEESLLGAMMLSAEAIASAAGVVTASDFYKPAHGHVYDSIHTLYASGQPVDSVTVADELRRANLLEAIGGPAVLAQIMSSTPATTNAGRYATIVEEYSLLRRLIGVAAEIAELGYSVPDDVTKALDRAESLVYEVNERRVTDSTRQIADLLSDNLQRFEDLFEKGESITGTPTGYIDLDALLSGLQPSSLVVVGARPAMGKTSFALGMVAHAALEAQRPVLFFSLEMSSLELSQRLLCAEAKVDSTRARNGRLEPEDWTKISRAIGRLGEAKIWIDDNPNLTIMEIRAKARRLKSQIGDLGMIVIDYLQLMTGRSNAENRQVEVSELSRGLKILARELETPVVALSQLSRGLEMRADKRPMLADLRESGCLTADARVLRADTGAEVTMGELLVSGATNIPVWSLDRDLRMVPATMTNVFPTGVKEVFELRLASGRTVTASANHPFLTVDGWKRLDELAPGGRIAVPRRVPAPLDPQRWPVAEVVMLAHLLGDGCVASRQPVHYTSADPANLAAVEQAAAHFGITPRRVEQRTWSHVYLPSPHHLTHGRRNPIQAWLEPMGLAGLRSHEKFVPEPVFRLPDDQVSLFLRHLWATDGCIHVRGRLATIYYATTSRPLADGIQQLLLRLGVQSRVRQVPQGEHRPAFHLSITGAANQLRFLEQVGVHGQRGVQAAEAAALLRTIVPNTNNDTVPREVWDRVKAAMRTSGVTARELAAGLGTAYCGSTLYKHSPSRERLGRVATLVEDRVIDALATSDVYWDQIVGIEPRGEEPVYDATVIGTHNFVANGITVENSIEQDSDVVMFIFREEIYDPKPENAGQAEIIVAKHRSGPTGVVQLAFLPQYTRFANMARGFD
jgi:replicative DNA helicase